MTTAAYPIRLVALTVDAFRGWSCSQRLPLHAGLTLLVGHNGAGKSSLINAVEWALFGAQVARKSSGLEERGEWEIGNRLAPRGPEVRLELELAEGTATLVRRREREAKLRDPDQVRLELPSGEVLEGTAVEDWLSSSGLPDWATWKYAFCQHQEQPRARVMDTSARSVQLGRLLGLDDYRRTSDELRALKFRELALRARGELDSIEDELTRSLERPDRELRALEERLEGRGIARTRIGEATFRSRLEALVAEGRRMASRLELDGALPDATLSSAAEVLRWAHDWPSQVQDQRQRLERTRNVLARELRELEAALQGIEPAKRRRKDARDAWKSWVTEYGTAEALEREADELRHERERLRSLQRERDEHAQLLQQALEFVTALERDDACPVCGQEATDLRLALRGQLETRGKAHPELSERADELREREVRLEQQRTRLKRLVSDVELADEEYARLNRQLEARMPVDSASTPLDELRAEWSERGQRQQQLLDELDEHLVAHRSEVEILEMLSRWQVARSRADAAVGDLNRIEAWNELQAAIDDAARLAVDLDVLGQMAREAQGERSDERVREVNRALGIHYGRITGDPQDRSVRVRVKATAARLTYHLVDGEGRNITPILNQAGLNALSMAILFAQAEERARRELPQWLLLDDPGQSLDERAAQGLARALLAISPRIPTLVATFPGALSEALSEAPAGDCRVFEIATDGAGRSVALEELRA